MPRQQGHDFSAMEMVSGPTDSGPGMQSFNGAMTFQPWKYRIFCHNQYVVEVLQWGHDFSAMEINNRLSADVGGL